MAVSADQVNIELRAPLAGLSRDLTGAARQIEGYEKRIVRSARSAADAQIREARRAADVLRTSSAPNLGVGGSTSAGGAGARQSAHQFVVEALGLIPKEALANLRPASELPKQGVVVAQALQGAATALGAFVDAKSVLESIGSDDDAKDRLQTLLATLHNSEDRGQAAWRYIEESSKRFNVDPMGFGAAYAELQPLVERGILSVEQLQKILDGLGRVSSSNGRPSSSVAEAANLLQKEIQSGPLTVGTFRQIGDLYGLDFSQRLRNSLPESIPENAWRYDNRESLSSTDTAIESLVGVLRAYPDPMQRRFELARDKVEQDQKEFYQSGRSSDGSLAARGEDESYLRRWDDISAALRSWGLAAEQRDLQDRETLLGLFRQLPAARSMDTPSTQDEPGHRGSFGEQVVVPTPVGQWANAGLPVHGSDVSRSAPTSVGRLPASEVATSLLSNQERYAALLQAAQPLIAAYRAELEALTVQEATRDAQLKAGTITQAEHTKAQEEAEERQTEVAEAVTAVGGVFTSGIKGAKDFNDALDSIGLGLLDLAAKGLFGQGALGGVFNQLLGVGPGGAGLLSLPGGSSGGSSGGGFWGGIGNLFGDLFGSIFGRASGGQALPGRIYEVGEAGREWFAPSVPGQVIPNHVIKAAAGGGAGSNQPITFNISMAGANGDRAIAEIAAAAVKKGLTGVPEINRQHRIRFA